MYVFVLTEERVWDAYEPSYEQVSGVFSSEERALEEINRMSFGRKVTYLEDEDRYFFRNQEDDFYYRIFMLELDK